MTRRRWCAALVIALLCAPAFARGAAEPAAEQTLWAGVGRAEITPPVGTPLAGYSKRHGEPSTAVAAPLYARALVLRQGTTTAILVSVELLIIDEPLYDAVAARVPRSAGEPPAALLLSATHTHSGPGAYGRHVLERASMGHYDPRVFERIVAGISAAVAQAWQHVAPVDVGYGEAPLDALVRNRRDASGLVDATLQVIALRARDGAVRAILVNDAAHPTALGAGNFVLSGDYPGVLMRALEAQHPGSACLFTIGNLGDQGPAMVEKTFSRMTEYGARLAAAAAHAVSQMSWEAAPPFHVETMSAPLPSPRVRLKFLTLPGPLSRLVVGGPHVARLALIRLGDLALIGYPGEPTARVGQQLKQRVAHAGARGYLMALTNPYIGYVLSPQEMAAGGYEAQMCFFGPEAGRRLEETIMTLMERMNHAAPAQ